jgi:hypothetical protein
MGGVYTVDGIRNVIRMAELVAGSPEALRQRPFISMVACIISPFKLDEEYGRLAIEVAKNNIPLVVPAEPLCGATAPITLAGNIVIECVDTLTGVMLAQLVNPGTPVLFGCVASITDLRDMKYLAGAVEMGLLNAAASQMAQFYKLPIYATAGMTDSKVNDAQAGYESALTNLMVALAGGNFIHDAAGFIEFCLTASYDKLVIDNEIIGMVMRAVEGIRVDETTLAFDEIRKVGPGGHFVSSRHTRRHMRGEQYKPTLSDRENRDVWTAAGGKDARRRATEIARRGIERRSGALDRCRGAPPNHRRDSGASVLPDGIKEVCHDHHRRKNQRHPRDGTRYHRTAAGRSAGRSGPPTGCGRCVLYRCECRHRQRVAAGRDRVHALGGRRAEYSDRKTVVHRQCRCRGTGSRDLRKGAGGPP